MMGPSRRSLFLFAAVAVAAALAAVWQAPAALVDGHLARTSAGMLRLDRAEGTVWQARGVLIAGTVGIPIAWRVEAWPLLRGEVRLHVLPDADPPTRSPRADLVIASRRLTVRDAEVSFPASLMPAAYGTAAWAAGGNVSVSAADIDWAPPASRGAMRILWRAARLVLPTSNSPVDLGDISIALSADGERLSGPISNDGGDLGVRGELTVRADDAVEVSLVLTPRRADDLQLTRTLAAIATADGSGWRISRRLPLR
jgi:hypothetical protein